MISRADKLHQIHHNSNGGLLGHNRPRSENRCNCEYRALEVRDTSCEEDGNERDEIEECIE